MCILVFLVILSAFQKFNRQIDEYMFWSFSSCMLRILTFISMFDCLKKTYNENAKNHNIRMSTHFL